MEERIKNKVREIQHKYCGEPVETKLYYAIEKTEKSIIKNIQEFNEETYGYCKDSCESQEYDAINNLIKELELNSETNLIGTMENKTIKELLDYTWKLEEQMRSELLDNFLKLSQHHSEISKIRDTLIELEILLNSSEDKPKTK